jgi:glycosyltransferase involved in cell wall biosynthesis
MKPWHGVHELLSAFASVAGDSWHLVMAGAGPEDAALMARVVDEAALRGRVHLLGALPHEDIGPLLRALDVGVAPYVPSPDFYFSPLKVLEYLAAGLPVVFPDIGDLPELVGAGGLSYSAGEVDALARTLALLADDAALRRSLAGEARRQALRWSWAETASRVEALAERARSMSVP